MPRAKNGDTVRINYTGKLTDGTPFDSSAERAPLEFRLGAHEIIEGLEREVVGMEVGQTATVMVACKDAYGDPDPAKIQRVSRARIQPGLSLETGMKLQAKTGDGRTIALTVVDVDEQDVTVDGNHPLAGQDLVFDIELLEIVQAA